MVNLTIKDFYRIVKNAVRYYPATSPVRKCLQPQTFRVLARDPRSNAEIGTDTLGATPTDKTKGFFWSRIWEQKKSAPGDLSFEYPIVVCFPLSRKKNTYSIEIAVLDVYKPESCVDDQLNTCDGRPINDIYIDTEQILESVVDYVMSSVSATTQTDNIEKIYNNDFLIANYPNQHNVMSHIGAAWKSKNQDLYYSYVEYAAKNIFGTKTRIDVNFPECNTTVFNTLIDEPEKIGFEAGCTNC